jgi:hypothetical protein
VSDVVRIAMWSGPRNVSTALMRAWGSRPDTAVCDEPLYAHWLWRTGTLHPGADEVLAHHERDWRAAVEVLLGPVPGEKRIFYQKHMAHHLLPEVGREWLEGLRHAFLIRDPREMLLSLSKVVERPRLADTGLPQQVELFERLAERGGSAPPVLDARDVLLDPRGALERLCTALEVEFLPAMLAWEPGPRATDGVWAQHWYAAVWRSRGFEPWRARAGRLPDALAPLLAACEPLHERLHRHRLRA